MHGYVRFVLYGLMVLLSGTPVMAGQPGFQWGRQFGTAVEDFGKSIAIDPAGDVLVTGWTAGELCGRPLGGEDVFLYKLTPDGDIRWSTQVGTAADEQGHELAVDSAGNCYITGWTKGDFGGVNSGDDDMFLVKIDPAGKQVWVRQAGTPGADQGQYLEIGPDGHIYVTGSTGGDLAAESRGQADVFLLEYDADGMLVSKRQFGWERNDAGRGLAFDGNGSVYVCGHAQMLPEGGGTPALDGFIARFDESGDLSWRKTFDTDENDDAANIRIDRDGNLIVGGSTAGTIGGAQAGNGDAYIAKFDPSGNKIWADQFGRDKWDGVLSVVFAVDGSDDIVISGCQNWDTCEGYCRRYSKAGDLRWSQEFIAQSALGGTCGKDVAVDKEGNFYHVGGTQASVFAPLAGGHDMYVVKIIDSTTPSSR